MHTNFTHEIRGKVGKVEKEPNYALWGILMVLAMLLAGYADGINRSLGM